MSHKINFNKTLFSKSAAGMRDLPSTSVAEVAFVGRSNAGKSSALNAISGIGGLARISKTPGRTQLINFFNVPCADREIYLVDLPGYGYAKVPNQVKQDWRELLTEYLELRACLSGIILLIDIRHPLKPLDLQMLEWCCSRSLRLHILLTKADKLSFGQSKTTLLQITKLLQANYNNELISAQLFSAHSKLGVDEARNVIAGWLNG